MTIGDQGETRPGGPTGSREHFSETLEMMITDNEGLFAAELPFMEAVLRGVTDRLKPDVTPDDLILATELYIYDVGTGINGFTEEPMPDEVQGIPIKPAAAFIRMAARDVADRAFGEEFAQAVTQRYEATSAHPSE